MELLDNGLRRLERLLEAIAGLALVVMMLVISADGGGRYLFDRPLPSVYELVELYLMIALIFLALPGLQAMRSNPAVTLLFRLFPAGLQRWLDVGFLTIALAVITLMAWKAAETAWISFAESRVINGVIDMPTGPSWVFAAVGLSVLALRLLVQLLTRLAGREPQAAVQIEH
ncbi:TRAP transporter small permease [Desertibaculum subflavum]|uniref:TRAP transporter small permease n=1 Tax=Desertibaculum subflavum TaxID=2268458 RepID=UPI0013C49248